MEQIKSEAVTLAISTELNPKPLENNFEFPTMKVDTVEGKRMFMAEVVKKLAEAKKASDEYLTPIINNLKQAPAAKKDLDLTTLD